MKQMCALFSKLLIRGEWSALEEREEPQLNINIYKTFSENANVLTFEGNRGKKTIILYEGQTLMQVQLLSLAQCR